MIKDRLRLYRNAGITTIQAKLAGDCQNRVETAAQLIELVDELNAETPLTSTTRR